MRMKSLLLFARLHYELNYVNFMSGIIFNAIILSLFKLLFIEKGMKEKKDVS